MQDPQQYRRGYSVRGREPESETGFSGREVATRRGDHEKECLWRRQEEGEGEDENLADCLGSGLKLGRFWGC